MDTRRAVSSEKQPPERSAIQQAVDNYCRAVEAGSAKARDHLRGFVLSVINSPHHDGSWQIVMGNATNEYLAKHRAAVADVHKLFSLVQLLRIQKFKVRLGGSDANLREILRECVGRFGDDYLCLLGQRLADAMTEVVG